MLGETPYAEYNGDVRCAQAGGAPARFTRPTCAVLQRVSGKGRAGGHGAVFGRRPAYANDLINLSDAFVAAFLPGTEGEGIGRSAGRRAPTTSSAAFLRLAGLGLLDRRGAGEHRPVRPRLWAQLRSRAAPGRCPAGGAHGLPTTPRTAVAGDRAGCKAGVTSEGWTATMQQIKRILIVGGGTAGWMTAALLGKLFQGLLRDHAGRVRGDRHGRRRRGHHPGDQEVSTSCSGSTRTTSCRRTQGSFKLGIQFVDWRAQGRAAISMASA